MKNIEKYQLRTGNFIIFCDEIHKVAEIYQENTVCLEVLEIQESDYPEPITFIIDDIQNEILLPVFASAENLKICGLQFPIVTNDYIITYNLNDLKLTIDHFTIKNKHTFTVVFIHDIQNFIIDFTKIKV